MDKRKSLNAVRDCVAESSLIVAEWELIMLVAAKEALIKSIDVYQSDRKVRG